MEYIPGPTWISDIGCYEDEKEMYENMDLEKLDDNAFYGKEDEDMEDFKGDFEGEDMEDFNDQDYKEFLKNNNNNNYNDLLKGLNLKNLNTNDKKSVDDILNKLQGTNIFEKVTNTKKTEGKKKKKSTKKVKNDDDWETASDS